MEGGVWWSFRTAGRHHLSLPVTRPRARGFAADAPKRMNNKLHRTGDDFRSPTVDKESARNQTACLES
ncbi:hypothetical protein INR49_022063 [Caranx melampygus]|nr:hypothetical protein INR49_022063 [Caranx melampygus]